MNNTKNPYLIDLTNDFGFTAADDDSHQISKLESVVETNYQENIDLKLRLEAIRAIFLPLLENLKKDPDKPFIKWPNRKDVLDKQIKKLIELTSVTTK